MRQLSSLLVEAVRYMSSTQQFHINSSVHGDYPLPGDSRHRFNQWAGKSAHHAFPEVVAVFDSFTLLASTGICCSVAAMLSIYWSMTDEDDRRQRCTVRISER